MQNRSRILDAIVKPHDIQTLSTQELEQLSEDCRQRIIEVTSQKGGHLASSLGAVEIAVALFKVFDFRRDRVVWDVGHQAYAHKLLSGRNERFETLAQYGGIKKFLSRDESSYDHFGAGHASTSISAALGMAFSRDLQQQAHYVVAVIGDGAMTGGLAFEALNHNGFASKNMILIVNDNGMSIDPNVGALSKMITRVISSPSYNWLRDETREWASRVPFSEPLQHALQKINTSLKTFLLPGMLFEQLGWRYFGPIDGHSVGELVELLTHVKDLDGPIVIHALTQKGKGYSFAEEDAFTYHGVSPFEPETGNFVKKSSSGIQQKSYSKVFAEKLGDLMEADSQVVALSAAMMSGTGIIGLHEKYPERVLDVGIAEGHAVTCAAGLAAEGSKPFVAIYSTFLQRALDHIIHDVAIQKLPVRFALDRAGLVGVDGPTHHGCFDLTYLRMIPNMVVMVPADGSELRLMTQFAYEHDGPIAMRYPRGNTTAWDESATEPIQLGKGMVLQDGSDVAIFAVGVLVETAIAVAEILKEQGLRVAVINARFVKPLDEKLLQKFAKSCQLIVTLEENVIAGGFGSAVLESLQQSGTVVPVQTIGLPDRYISQGSPEQQREDAGLSVTKIVGSITGRLKELTPRIQKPSKTVKKAS